MSFPYKEKIQDTCHIGLLCCMNCYANKSRTDIISIYNNSVVIWGYHRAHYFKSIVGFLKLTKTQKSKTLLKTTIPIWNSLLTLHLECFKASTIGFLRFISKCFHKFKLKFQDSQVFTKHKHNLSSFSIIEIEMDHISESHIFNRQI